MRKNLAFPQVFRRVSLFLFIGMQAVFYMGTPSRPAQSKPVSGEKRDLSALVSRIEDIEASLKVLQYDPKELEKIGSDFGTTYRFKTLSFQYKQPDKIRLEAKSQTLGTATFILNGKSRYYNIPRLRLRKTEDLTTSPGKRQSLLEYGGLISEGTLHFMAGKYLREETLDGASLAVYDLRYLNAKSASYYRVWVDLKTHITVKREWYDSESHLKATFLYLEPQEIAPGIWMPNRVEVRNGEGVLAAITGFESLKVNKGVSEDAFHVSP